MAGLVQHKQMNRRTSRAKAIAIATQRTILILQASGLMLATLLALLLINP